jgi:hypothetical protein
MGLKPAHFVTIRLRYMARQDGTKYPWKWGAECSCGWGCLSWSWSRAYSAANDPAWEREGNSTVGGALPMALDHLAERQAEIDEAIASIQTSIQTQPS